MASKRKLKELYDADAMSRCIRDVVENKISVYQASKNYNIPSSTIRHRIKQGLGGGDCRMGPSTALSGEEEASIVHWAHNSILRGFCVQRSSVVEAVSAILEDNPRVTTFKEGKPGRRWYNGFLGRHPGLTITSENKREVTTLDEVNMWFLNTTTVLSEHNALDVLTDASRIFYYRQWNYCLADNKIIGDKGVLHSNSTCVNVALRADGEIIPPDVIPDDQLSSANPAESGQMRQIGTGQVRDRLFDFICSVLQPWLLSRKIKFPILLFVHATKLSYRAFNVCQSLNIIPVAMYPGAPGIFSLDIHFEQMASNWAEERRKHSLSPKCTMEMFPSVLLRTFSDCCSQSVVQAGFAVNGLYPFDFSTLDMSSIAAINEASKHPSPPPFDCSLLDTGSSTALNEVYKDPTPPLDDTTPSDEMVPISKTILLECLGRLGERRKTVYRQSSPEDLLCEGEQILCFMFKKLLEPLDEPSNCKYRTEEIIEIKQEQLNECSEFEGVSLFCEVEQSDGNDTGHIKVEPENE